MVYQKNGDGFYWAIFLTYFLTACGTNLSGAVLGGGTNGDAASDTAGTVLGDVVEEDDEGIPIATDEIIAEEGVEIFEAIDLDSANHVSDESGDADMDLEGGTPSGPVAFPVTWPKEGDDCVLDEAEMMAVSYDGSGQTTYFVMPNDGKNHQFYLSGEITTLICEDSKDDGTYVWMPEDYLEGDFVITLQNQVKDGVIGKKKVKITIDGY